MQGETERELELKLEKVELLVALQQAVRALAELEAACAARGEHHRPLAEDHASRAQARLVVSLAGRFL